MLYPDFNELVQLGGTRTRFDVKSKRNMLSAASGSYSSPFRGHGLTFQEVREYRPGDDVRQIDWRVTARMNKPHLKVFTEDRERTVMLCVDANAAMRFGTRGTFKSVQAARAAALLGSLANGGQDRVGCLLFGDVPQGVQIFRPTRSRRALWQALKQLSQQQAGFHPAPIPVEAVLQRLSRLMPSGSLLFIIGDFAQAGNVLERELTGLRYRCDVVLIRIGDPADAVIPPVGPLWFSDAGGEAVAIDTDSKAGQEAYAAQWRAQRNRLEDICARNGIGLIDLHTNGNVRDDLLPGLRRLAFGGRR